MRVREVKLIFEPRDLWIGVYWDRSTLGIWWGIKVYICLIPCLPLRVWVSQS